VAASFAIFRALFRSVRRNLGTFGSIKVNNFFLFVALIAYGALDSGVQPVSSYPFLLLLGLLMLFPLSSDPLSRIPRSRLGLWPLGSGQRSALRVASLALSPIFWAAALMLARTSRPAPALALCGAAVVVRGLAAPRWAPLRILPRGPGRLGQLFRANLRQMFTVLDTWVAVLLSLGGAAWRIAARDPDPAAFPILSILVALALSTYAQCLFSLDSASGLTRYRLLPLRGWEILLAKDAAYLALLMFLLLPLDVPAGLTFGLVSLAAGRYPAVSGVLPVERWRFASGRIRFGVLQCVLGIGLAAAEARQGPLYLLGAALLYAASYLKQDSVVRQ
jgi:hypothetical protein